MTFLIEGVGDLSEPLLQSPYVALFFSLHSLNSILRRWMSQFSWKSCYSSEKIAKPLDLMKVKNI